MQTYWNMLERKRKQLEGEKEQMAARTSLPQSIRHIQLDLRDLMKQVSIQVGRLTEIHPHFVPYAYAFFGGSDTAPGLKLYSFAFFFRWVSQAALRINRRIILPWVQTEAPNPNGTAEWRVMSFWEIWIFTSSSWQETFSSWLQKHSHDSTLKTDNTCLNPTMKTLGI